jgi:hypothetical protein
MSKSKNYDKIMRRGEIAPKMHIGASSELITLRHKKLIPIKESMPLSDVPVENCPHLEKLLKQYPDSTVMDFGGTPILNVHIN